MEIKHHIAAGSTIELRHGLAGPIPLEFSSIIQAYKFTDKDRQAYHAAVTEWNRLQSHADHYGAEKLGADLQAAQAAIAESITQEGIDEVARLSALAADPAVRRRVEQETNAAVQPALQKLDLSMRPLALKVIDHTRSVITSATSNLDLKKLEVAILGDQMAQIMQFANDRIAATHAQLDQLAEWTAAGGSIAFLRDKANLG